MSMMNLCMILTIEQLRDGMTRQLNAAGGQSEEMDLLNWMGRAALELVGQGGLGYSFDPLIEDAHNEYGDALKQIL